MLAVCGLCAGCVRNVPSNRGKCHVHWGPRAGWAEQRAKREREVKGGYMRGACQNPIALNRLEIRIAPKSGAGRALVVGGADGSGGRGFI